MKRTKQATFAKRERQETGPRFDPVGGAQFTPLQCSCFSEKHHNITYCTMHAAAPAMYEALQEIDDQLDQFTVKAQEDLGLRGALLRIRDALAQAEGR